jgi:hypothetical protein
MNDNTNFTDDEIKTIRTNYIQKHGIYTGVSVRNHRRVATRVLSTYWTKCPFLTNDHTKHEKFTVESETPTFIKFHQKPYRFRKEVIRKGDAYTQLSIAYRDTALNKERFNYGGDTRPEHLPSWEVVKHYTDVLVRWDDADHTVDETYDELWFLPNKLMYMGVAVELKEERGTAYPQTTVFCSPTKTERTPTPVPLNTRGEFQKSSGRHFNRTNYNGNPFERWSTNLDAHDDYSSRHTSRKVYLIDGEEATLHYHADYNEKKAFYERFSAQCEPTLTPFHLTLTVSYFPTRKTTIQHYSSTIFTINGLASLTDMKHSASTVPLKEPKIEAMRKQKEAFADELVRTCLHPERLERLYGEGFVDIIADQ